MFQRNYINNVKNIESFLLDVNNNDKCMFIVNKKKTYVYLENIQAKKEKDTTKKETTKKDTTKKDTTNKDKTYYLIDKHLL